MREPAEDLRRIAFCLERALEPSASRTWLLAAARPIPTANAN